MPAHVSGLQVISVQAPDLAVALGAEVGDMVTNEYTAFGLPVGGDANADVSGPLADDIDGAFLATKDDIGGTERW